MTIKFDDNKEEIQINSYNHDDGVLLINLYSNDYNDIKKKVFDADKNLITIILSDKSQRTFENYTEITSLSSIVDNDDLRDYITISFTKNEQSIKDILIENKRLAKENEELKSKISKMK